MKFRILSVVALLTIAAGLAAQTGAAPTSNANSAPVSKACACCSHDKVESGSGACCTSCCKDGKCPMTSGSREGMKCPMMAKDGKMADGKMCCSGDKCPVHAKGENGNGCCCGRMGNRQHAGI